MNTRPIPTPEAVEAAINLGWNADCKIEEAERRLTPKAEGLWLDLYRASAVVLAIEVQRLRALLDKPQGFRNAPPRTIVIHDEAEHWCDEARKQIKPGPDKPKPDYEMYCASCGQPSPTSHWFGNGHTAVCPQCASEYVCNAGRVG